MKIFRDPVHNVIDLDTGDKTVNSLIIKLIDSKEFQRLRRIKQLGFADFAYPNATHTRFAHSLGVAFLAKRFIEKIISMEDRILSYNKSSPHKHKLENFFEQIKRDKPLAIVAALLHDIGHGFLSHASEDIIGINHEVWVRDIILGDTEVNKILTAYNQYCPQTIIDILNSSGNHIHSGKIIDGTIDVDKMDYLLRDSHMTGSGYGRFDLEWLLNVISVGIHNNQVVIGLDEGKGLSLAEDFVMARIYMHKNVYLHKTSMVASEMLKLLFIRLKELPYENNMKKLCCGDSITLANYLAVSDEHYYVFLSQLQNSNDEVLSKLSSGLYNRQLYKEIDKKQWQDLTLYISDVKGADMVKYYAFEVKSDSIKEKLAYQPGKDEIILFDKNGNARELLSKSLIVPLNMDNYQHHVGYYVDLEIAEKYTNT